MPPRAAFTLEELAVRAVDDVLAVVPSSAAAVFLLDEESGQVRLHTSRGGDDTTFASVPARVRGPLGAPATLVPPGEGIAFLAVPLRSRNRFCGLVAILLTAEPRLTATQRTRLQSIGDRAGELIEAAQLSANLERRRDQLQSLYHAGILLTSRLELDTVMQRVVDMAAELLDARYAALGIADADGVIERFFTFGLTPAERARIGPLPRGEGLLGAIIHERVTIRLSDLTTDARSSGFPQHHPPMRSFIGMPIRLGDEVLGNLYLTEKRGGDFTREDESLLGLLASQAAVAIENARLYQQVKRLAVLEERDRIAMNLHDSTIQSIYAVGLGLEEVQHAISEGSGEAAHDQIDTAIARLNVVISEIREYIHQLREGSPATLGARIEQLVREAMGSGGPALHLAIRDDLVERLAPDRMEALLFILREALSNIRRHSGARNVEVSLREARGAAELVIRDDGTGFDTSAGYAGMGLPNMRERVAPFAAKLRLESGDGGTTISVEMALV